MTYDEAEEYLIRLGAKGIVPGLDNVLKLAEKFNNPQNLIKVIHVAGTNGKGSTSLFISEILRAQGYRVGVYASPAVFTPLEIIRVNGRNISKADFAGIISEIALKNDDCTRFEVETLAAFIYFARKDCDVAVIEAGMGGLSDATNIVNNTAVSVITEVGMDHMQYLGDTLYKIAENKAGIIKTGSKVVYINKDDDAEKVINSISKKQNAEAIPVATEVIKKVKYSLSGSSFSYKGEEYKISMAGEYQIRNACLAIEAVMVAARKGLPVETVFIKKGLKKAFNPGRFEIVSDRPRIILDGAHNIPAARALKISLQTYFTKKKYIYIMGMFRDKDADSVIELMAPLAEHIITVTLPNKARSLSAYELAEKVSRINPVVTAADSIFEACELAGLMADKDTVIVVWGSLSHLNSAKEVFMKKHPGRKDTKV